MATHDEILAVVQRVAAARADWSFFPNEIVRELPHLNAGTIRTHITSRCCTNAPKNHPHRWDYFKRLERGRYQVMPRYRPSRTRAGVVREQPAMFAASPAPAARRTIHAAIHRSGAWYSAECLEIAVVTQGRTLDQTVANLREAIALHLEGDDPETLGLATPLALHVTIEEDVA
jgi:predicted RNase H-like HicB family nuclease